MVNFLHITYDNLHSQQTIHVRRILLTHKSWFFCAHEWNIHYLTNLTVLKIQLVILYHKRTFKKCDRKMSFHSDHMNDILKQSISKIWTRRKLIPTRGETAIFQNQQPTLRVLLAHTHYLPWVSENNDL